MELKQIIDESTGICTDSVLLIDSIIVSACLNASDCAVLKLNASAITDHCVVRLPTGRGAYISRIFNDLAAPDFDSFYDDLVAIPFYNIHSINL